MESLPLDPARNRGEQCELDNTRRGAPETTDNMRGGESTSKNEKTGFLLLLSVLLLCCVPDGYAGRSHPGRRAKRTSLVPGPWRRLQRFVQPGKRLNSDDSQNLLVASIAGNADHTFARETEQLFPGLAAYERIKWVVIGFAV